MNTQNDEEGMGNRKARHGMLYWIVVALSVLALVFALGAGLLFLGCSGGELGTEVYPEKQGFSSKILAECINTIRNDGMRVHSLLLARSGEIIFDAYFDPYHGATYHKLASVTKSVTGILIGIARDEGLLKLDDTVLSFFPERKVADPDGLKATITVRDLLTMRSGFAGNYRNDEEDLALARATDDWVGYALDRTMSAKPGIRFQYAGLDSHLLSAIITKVTGKSALAYAREKLFSPLGIEEVFWDVDTKGNNRGWGDLCMFPRDMAKLGQLFLNGGTWEGATIISRQWIEEAAQRHVRTPSYFPEDYGYHLRISKEDEIYSFFEASGNGEQKIRIYPEIGVLIVTTGAGFDFGKLGGMLGKAFTSPQKPLPRNPSGEKALLKVIEASTAKAVQSVPVDLPPIATKISGKQYNFSSNILSLKAITISFVDGKEASFDYSYSGDTEFRHARIGLDGIARTSTTGLPLYLQGAWTDDHTLEVEWSEGPGMNIILLKMVFVDESIQFQVQVGGGQEVEIVGFSG